MSTTLRFAHATTLPNGRYAACVIEPQWAKDWSRQLKRRIDDVINPYHCLDWCWYRDHRAEIWLRRRRRPLIDRRFLRGQDRAYAWLQPDWVFCDVRGCFPSMERAHLRKQLHRLAHRNDPSLPDAVDRHLERLNFDLADGLPTGSAVSCALANAYLLNVDRWLVGSGIRFGDNYAVAPGKLPELRNRLRDIGLDTKLRDTFTNRKANTATSSPSAGCPTPPPAATGSAQGSAPKGRQRGAQHRHHAIHRMHKEATL